MPGLRARYSLALGLPAEAKLRTSSRGPTFARLRLAARAFGACARRPTVVGLLAVAALCFACGPRSDGGGELPTATIHVGNHRLTVEIAATPAARARGLMFREKLAPDRGMLFVFPDERVLEFWMRNTEIPLSIAFAQASGRIVHIADMEPRSEALVSSGVPVKYALEVNQGWYAAHAVQSGDSLGRLPSLRAE